MFSRSLTLLNVGVITLQASVTSLDTVLSLAFGCIIGNNSVGIKGSHVWSHDQGDRPNHVTNLS
jgi:hypothetical protein